MSNYKVFAAKILTSSEVDLYSRTDGFIIKTIMIYNPSLSTKSVDLKFDGIDFVVKLEADETKILSNAVFCKSLKGSGDGVSIHVSGLQE